MTDIDDFDQFLLLKISTVFTICDWVHLHNFCHFSKEDNFCHLQFASVLALALASALAKSFNLKVFYVMGKGLSGKLSCPCDRSCYGIS